MQSCRLRILVVCALSLFGCRVSEMTSTPVGDAGVVVWDGVGPTPDAQLPDLGAQPECKKSADCNGGYCVDGSCCPTKERICGDRCCAAGAVCFANACVTPGKTCLSAGDCAADQYCEPGLGDKQATPPTPPPGKVCLAPAPSPGRCLDLPPVCDKTGGPAGCLPACEYHPTAGNLNAQMAWSWGTNAKEHTGLIDVWSTPVVGRLYDTNCDGQVNELDPPNVVFVSGDVKGGCACSSDKSKTGALRVLDGASGKEIWTLRQADPSSTGFAGFTVALGDVDKDGSMDIVAVTGEGYVVLIDADGKVQRTSDKPIPEATHTSFGWGGALALADMDTDGYPEIAYGSTVFTTKGGGITHVFSGSGGLGGAKNRAISTFVDLDGAPDGHLELLAGRVAFQSDGTPLWSRTDLTDGYPAVGDLDLDGTPEVVLVAKRTVWILDGATGQTELGPLTLPGSTSDNGGPPTVADFDGDKKPEIGVALREYYYMLEPDYSAGEIKQVWSAANHDLSSSVTGSTVFDFEGDGSAEVIYNDECFLWVYDGKTGAVRFATPTTSFTATEASMVADVDGDGKAEILMIGNSANPGATGWKCDVAPWNQPDPTTGRPAWQPPPGGTVYRGVTMWRDTASSWVGTRTLWNQHTYHVSNICDDRDSACAAPNTYGSIPTRENRNWKVGWLNNFRQNVQDKGIFNAPDATVSLKVDCSAPLVLHAYLRNQGLALLPAGVKVGLYRVDGAKEQLLHTITSTTPLFPGQVEELVQVLSTNDGPEIYFRGRVEIDPSNPTFHECREANNASGAVRADCILE